MDRWNIDYVKAMAILNIFQELQPENREEVINKILKLDDMLLERENRARQQEFMRRLNIEHLHNEDDSGLDW